MMESFPAYRNPTADAKDEDDSTSFKKDIDANIPTPETDSHEPNVMAFVDSLWIHALDDTSSQVQSMNRRLSSLLQLVALSVMVAFMAITVLAIDTGMVMAAPTGSSSLSSSSHGFIPANFERAQAEVAGALDNFEQLASCGAAGYDPSQYVCVSTENPPHFSNLLCPKSSPHACGASPSVFACYDASRYCCGSDGNLRQVGDAACVSGPGPSPSPTPTVPPTPTPTPTNNPPSGDSVDMIIVNQCKFNVWPGIYGLPKENGIPREGGWLQTSGEVVTLKLPKNWTSGRIWARTNCKTDSNGNFNCETGNCRDLKCQATTGIPNVLLAEWTFVPDGDFFDLSQVDAYNVGMRIEMIGGKPLSNKKYENCEPIQCSFGDDTRLNETCPREYQLTSKQNPGQVVACINQDENGESARAKFFKSKCPDAYSWPYDDPTSTFRCRQPAAYKLVFCP
ncbi:hypothetical protein HDU97_008097 [Phlyctochytrium planicorne]|nr:hypothetical protein HDU97_008097 [Phlyctochytrium planicorne]